MPSRIAVLSAALLMAPACGGRTPTAPSPGTTLAVTCNTSSLLAGDIATCRATMALMNVSASAQWTSSDPNVVTSQGAGLFIGKRGGQATLAATYSGQTGSAPLSVDLQDVIRATASASQGTFQVGTTATMWLQGFYGVASASSGTLTLVVSDQAGSTVSASEPLTVLYGGDRYLLSTTFALRPGTTRVCRTGVLQIGSTTLTAVPDVSLAPCIDVAP